MKLSELIQNNNEEIVKVGWNISGEGFNHEYAGHSSNDVDAVEIIDEGGDAREKANIIQHSLPNNILEYIEGEKKEYTGFCDKRGIKIYSGDWLEFRSQWQGEQVWASQVIFEDGVWTIDITNKKMIQPSKDWHTKYPDRDWTDTRAWACDVGYGEYGSWNDRRKSIVEIAGYFKSSDEMFKVRDEFNKRYGKYHSNDNLQRELPVLIIKGEKKVNNFRNHSTGFNQALQLVRNYIKEGLTK